MAGFILLDDAAKEIDAVSKRVELLFPGGITYYSVILGREVFSETHEALMLAALNCQLSAYNPLSGERLLPTETDKRIWTTPQDLNEWLKLNGYKYRFIDKSNFLSRWLDREFIRLDDAILLSLGLNPDEHQGDEPPEFCLKRDEFIARMDKAEQWCDNGELKADFKDREGWEEYININPISFFILAKSKGWTLPKSIHAFLNQRQNHKAETVESGSKIKKESGQTKEWKGKAREIGEQWMKAEREEGRDPGVDAIAKYVEGELSNRDIRGPRGKYLDWQTIKKEALTGITGRPANGKRPKS
jgi:hypothetical protein